MVIHSPPSKLFPALEGQGPWPSNPPLWLRHWPHVKRSGRDLTRAAARKRPSPTTARRPPRVPAPSLHATPPVAPTCRRPARPLTSPLPGRGHRPISNNKLGMGGSRDTKTAGPVTESLTGGARRLYSRCVDPRGWLDRVGPSVRPSVRRSAGCPRGGTTWPVNPDTCRQPSSGARGRDVERTGRSNRGYRQHNRYE